MGRDPKALGVLYAKQLIRATERAMERAAVAAYEDLKRGLNPLATVTSIAPFIGILGTVWAIAFDTFFGLGNSKLNGWLLSPRGFRARVSFRRSASPWGCNRCGATTISVGGSNSLTLKWRVSH